MSAAMHFAIPLRRIETHALLCLLLVFSSRLTAQSITNRERLTMEVSLIYPSGRTLELGPVAPGGSISITASLSKRTIRRGKVRFDYTTDCFRADVRAVNAEIDGRMRRAQNQAFLGGLLRELLGNTWLGKALTIYEAATQINDVIRGKQSLDKFLTDQSYDYAKQELLRGVDNRAGRSALAGFIAASEVSERNYPDLNARLEQAAEYLRKNYSRTVRLTDYFIEQLSWQVAVGGGCSFYRDMTYGESGATSFTPTGEARPAVARAQLDFPTRDLNGFFSLTGQLIQSPLLYSALGDTIMTAQSGLSFRSTSVGVAYTVGSGSTLRGFGVDIEGGYQFHWRRPFLVVADTIALSEAVSNEPYQYFGGGLYFAAGLSYNWRVLRPFAKYYLTAVQHSDEQPSREPNYTSQHLTVGLMIPLFSARRYIPR